MSTESRREIYEELYRRVQHLAIHTVIERHTPRTVAERNTKPIPRTFDAVALDGVWDVLETVLLGEEA